MYLSTVAETTISRCLPCSLANSIFLRLSTTLASAPDTMVRKSGRMLQAIESVLLRDPLDIVLVYGDTNSRLAGGLGGRLIASPKRSIECQRITSPTCSLRRTATAARNLDNE